MNTWQLQGRILELSLSVINPLVTSVAFWVLDRGYCKDIGLFLIGSGNIKEQQYPLEKSTNCGPFQT